MALCSVRLRRLLPLSFSSSSLIKHHRSFSILPPISPPPSLSSSNSQNPILDHHLHLPFQSSRPFRSSTFTLSPPRYPANNNEEIGPDTVLFEGCDYNHWLITMDFPKDPKPTPEEMVETYVQTLAKVVGSVEEAKKRMYACSTTTYTGFQAVMSEEMSEKFRGLPGVVFILPDSYIDPVNKEYGGDKYINGAIIPRSPPVQYGRQGGRFGDRNREYNRDRPRGPVPYRGSSGYENQGPRHGDTGNYGPQHNSPPQNYGGRDSYQGDRRNSMPPYQANYQGQREIPPGDRRNYPPPGQRDNRGENMNYVPAQSGAYGREMGSNYGQNQPGHGGDQRFSQVEQRNNTPGDQRNYPAMGPTDTNQGRY